MQRISMKNAWCILKTNFQLAIQHNLLLAIVFLMILPFIRGTENLDAIRSAECLEQFASLIGIFLLVPLAVPEQSKSIWEVTAVRKISTWSILLVRILVAILILIILTSVFAGSMLLKQCTFPYLCYVAGTVATELALGSIGLLAAVLCRSVVAGYFVSMGYFLIHYMGNVSSENIFYLFSMGTENYRTKIWLLGFSIAIMAITLCCEKKRS